MASISYDGRSFIIDGRRIWLVSGAIHYFRTPAALWPDRLLKAKRAGLNCIETYCAWNFHEMQEGKWDFTGDRDVAAFVELAGEMGLYVILRPGPYICAEWDFGGLPAYLATKSGIAYRTNNATYTHYFDKFFRQLLPRLADLQITRNGTIILVQNENEYFYTTMPDRLQYLEFINQLIRRAGFDIPIINCNCATDPPVPENIECVNGWGSEVQQLKAQRLRAPNAPLLMTEFWDGWFDPWGRPHERRDAREVARRAMEILGCASQYNYYMWHGGTNFAFWGSRLGAGDGAYQTASYDYDAPLAEGGALTDKYYLTRLVNLLANHMGTYFANCTMDIGATALNAPAVLNLSGPTGRWAIVTHNGQGQFPVARVALPDGRQIDVSLETFGAAAVPIGLKLPANHVLDWANLTPLGLFGEKMLVLHAPAGWKAQYSLDGNVTTIEVPSGSEVKLQQHGELVVAVINSSLAQRTWPLENCLLLGPTFVGKDAQEVQLAPRESEYAVLRFEGELTPRKVKPAPAAAPAAPKLTPLRKLTGCPELADAHAAWKPLDRPRDVDHLGAHYGYLWYRIERSEEKAVDRNIFLPECEDRANMYRNGELVGVWGRGSGATRDPLKVHFPRGASTLTILLDNLGRINFGSRLGELKGLYGHIYQAQAIQPKPGKPRAVENVARKALPRKLWHLVRMLESQTLTEFPLDLTLKKLLPVHVSFTNLPHHAALVCNGRTVAFFENTGGCGDLTLRNELKKGRNELSMLVWGQVDEKTLAGLKLHLLEENLTQEASWSFRTWEPPAGKPLPASDKTPAWYSAGFKHTPSALPLFVRIAGAGKGQLFLNDRNVGRFWTIGPQQYYYLPQPWLNPANELKLFVEHGERPQIELAYRPDGPFAP